jgi:hypothetical protein
MFGGKSQPLFVYYPKLFSTLDSHYIIIKNYKDSIDTKCVSTKYINGELVDFYMHYNDF